MDNEPRYEGGEACPSGEYYESSGGGVKTALQQGIDVAKQKTSELTEQTKVRAASMLSEQKNRAADTLGDVSHALHRSAEDLQQHQHDRIGYYTDKLAHQVDEFCSNLRTRDVNDLLDRVQGYARRRPEIFLAGIVALGFVAARFLKSSRPEYHSEVESPSMGSTSFQQSPGPEVVQPGGEVI